MRNWTPLCHVISRRVSQLDAPGAHLIDWGFCLTVEMKYGARFEQSCCWRFGVLDSGAFFRNVDVSSPDNQREDLEHLNRQLDVTGNTWKKGIIGAWGCGLVSSGLGWGHNRGLYVRVTHVFQISRNDLKILVSKGVTCTMLHTEGQQRGW